MTSLQLRHAGLSDVGIVRDHNEDALLVDPELQLFAVCDGVGGRKGGQEASSLATEHIRKMVAEQRDLLVSFATQGGARRREIASLLEHAISDASRQIRARALDKPELSGMATTAAVLLVVGSHAFVAHVGDSRVFLMRHRTLHLLTEDHSLINDLKRRGRDPDRSQLGAAYKGALTRALGVLDTARVDLLDLELLPGDRFVLTSDGVHGVIGDRQMQALAPMDDADSAAQAMIETALENGAPDNATVVVVDVLSDTEEDRAERVRRQLEALQAVSMFRYLPYPDLIRVASAAKEEHVPAGSDVFAEGDTGESLYIILEGRAAVIKSDIELAELTAGAHFGEMSLIERAPRSAGIRAKTPLSLLVLERDGFFSLLREEAAAVKLLWGMVRMLNARLRLTSDELTLLKQQAVGHDE